MTVVSMTAFPSGHRMLVAAVCNSLFQKLRFGNSSRIEICCTLPGDSVFNILLWQATCQLPRSGLQRRNPPPAPKRCFLRVTDHLLREYRLRVTGFRDWGPQTTAIARQQTRPEVAIGLTINRRVGCGLNDGHYDPIAAGLAIGLAATLGTTRFVKRKDPV
jgi:hypothetical protein